MRDISSRNLVGWFQLLRMIQPLIGQAYVVLAFFGPAHADGAFIIQLFSFKEIRQNPEIINCSECLRDF